MNLTLLLLAAFLILCIRKMGKAIHMLIALLVIAFVFVVVSNLSANQIVGSLLAHPIFTSF